MTVFKRRGKHEADSGADERLDDRVEGDEGGMTGEAVDAVDEATGPAPVERPQGPWDAEDAPADDQPRLDLGAVRLPGVDGMELQVNLDQETGAVAGVTAVLGEGALQVQAFAAPRSEGIWAEVREGLAAGITQQGGTVDEVAGPFGAELRARIPVAAEDGALGLQPVRFLGVDGPRWFLRGVLTGEAAADPASAGALEEVFRGTVVVRGNDPMAPQDPLPMRLPDDGSAAAAVAPVEADTGDPEPHTPPLPPIDLGPGHYITEIR